MSGRKKLNHIRSILANRRLAGCIVVSFIASLMYFCCCGISCADTSFDRVETPAHGGCCSSEPAPVESQDKGCCGDDCECSLKGEQDSYVLTENVPVPPPQLHALPPARYPEPALHAFEKFPIIGKTDLSRAPPLYLRFQTLLI